jgi:hypothetical protein
MRAHIHDDARAGREAITLPLLFIGVSLLSAVRIGAGGALRFLGPTLLALVLGVMLLGLLLRAGVLAPERLVSARRRALANANGITVLLTLLFASAQIFTMLTPEAGLMGILFSAFYLVLLWTTAAARPRARHLLRSLAVVFGSALVLRFVVLNGMAAPGGSFAHWLFATALEGLTLGGLGLEYHAPATGYAAFVALGLFFVALLLLPHDVRAWDVGGATPWGVELAPADGGELQQPQRHKDSDTGAF